MNLYLSKNSIVSPMKNLLSETGQVPISNRSIPVGVGSLSLDTVPGLSSELLNQRIPPWELGPGRFPNPENPYSGNVPPEVRVFPDNPDIQPPEPPWWQKYWWVVALGAIAVVYSISKSKSKKLKAVTSGSL